jgi:hypothetical protein
MSKVKERNLKVRAKKIKEVKEYKRWKDSVKDHETD